MKNKIIFLHIPRTGGTTFRDILDRLYHSNNVVEIKNFIDSEKIMKSIPKNEQSKIQLIKGHLNFGIHQWIKGPYKYITFLRHPLNRIISTFKYVKNNIKHPDHKSIQSMSMIEYFDSRKNILIDNGITRLLLGNNYDFNIPFGNIKEKHYKMALDNLKNNFLVAGITERFNESILILANELNWKSPYYSIANKSKNTNELIKTNIDDQIIKYYSYDLKLYNYVDQKLNQKIDSIPNFDSKLKHFNVANYLFGRFMIDLRIKRMLKRIIS